MRKFRLFIMCSIFIISSCSTEYQHNDETSPIEQVKTLTLKSGVIVQKQGNSYIWLGDIILSPLQLSYLDTTGGILVSPVNEPVKNIQPITNIPLVVISDKSGKTKATGVYPTPYNLWAMVRYTIHPELTSDRRVIVREAIRHWEATTNVRFYNATGKPTKDPTYGFEYPYVEFVNSNVNQSSVGRIGGRQEIRLSSYQSASTAIHEIGHAIGLFHEMSRNDRDTYVNINWANIKPEKRHNFDKITQNYLLVGNLDFESIMMYPSFIYDTDFVYDTSIPVITKKDGTTFKTSDILSFYDRNWANRLYIPYIARSDTYRELADVVYKSDNTLMTPQERLELQARLNDGNPEPPAGGRIPNEH